MFTDRSKLVAALLFYSSVCYPQEAQERFTYEVFLNSLATDTTIFGDSLTADEKFWTKFLKYQSDEDFDLGIYKDDRKSKVLQWVYRVFNHSNGEMSAEEYETPDITPMLTSALLYKGKKVKELRNSEANGRIGIAICVNDSATIYYALRVDPRITDEAFVFFREHELAHIVLGHTGCSPTSTERDQRKRELAADVYAGNNILRYVDGYRILDFVRGVFTGMNEKESSTHPATKSRANNIRKNCSKS